MSTIKEAIDLLNEKCHPAGFHVAMIRADGLEYDDLFGGDTDGDTPHDLMVQTYDWRYGNQPQKEEYSVRLTAGNMRFIGRAIEVYEQALRSRYEKEFKESITQVITKLGEAMERGDL